MARDVDKLSLCERETADDEIEITSEMARAGFDVLDDWTGVLDKGTLATEVYIAMVRAKVRPKLVRVVPSQTGRE
jgi:hypothetical protein